MSRRPSVFSRGLVAVTTLALVPLAACNDAGDEGGQYVLHLEGAAEVVGVDGTQTIATGDHELAEGAIVRITAGAALLELPDDGSLELREGRGDIDDSAVRLGSTPEVLDGDALLVASGDPVQLTAGRLAVGLRDGAARLRRSTGVVLAVYEGRAQVASLGRQLPNGVPAYRQVTVTDSGSLPRRPVPLVYDQVEPDPWDVRFLDEAIDLRGELDRRSDQLDKELNGAPAAPTATAAFLADRLPPLKAQAAFSDSLLASTPSAGRSPGETIVGASIALVGSGRFEDRWRSTFAFRADGADWGLVALDQRARRDTLFGVLLNVVPLVFPTLDLPDGSGGSVRLRTPASQPIGRPIVSTPPVPSSPPDPDPSAPPSNPPPSNPPSPKPPPLYPAPPVPPSFRPAGPPPLSKPEPDPDVEPCEGDRHDHKGNGRHKGKGHDRDWDDHKGKGNGHDPSKDDKSHGRSGDDDDDRGRRGRGRRG